MEAHRDSKSWKRAAVSVAGLILIVWLPQAVRAQDVSQPVLIIPPVDVPSTAEETPLADDVTQFIKGMALLLLPDTYRDDDDWGDTKRVQSGLNVRLDGLKLDTSRRWKDVYHGTWQRVDARLVNPAQHFQLAISVLPRTDPSSPRYRVRANMRLAATGCQQQWTLGVKLYSVSADVVADVAMDAVVEFRSQFVDDDASRRLRVLPHVETVSVVLRNMTLNRVSHAKGSAVREVGNLWESLVQRAVRRKSNHLSTKINAKIQKKPERFELPAGILGLLGGTEASEGDCASAAGEPADVRKQEAS
ncbi:MAG: hypothetical protein R3C59_30465 [Planctomycetaceae bacterium]